MDADSNCESTNYQDPAASSISKASCQGDHDAGYVSGIASLQIGAVSKVKRDSPREEAEDDLVEVAADNPAKGTAAADNLGVWGDKDEVWGDVNNSRTLPVAGTFEKMFEPSGIKLAAEQGVRIPQSQFLPKWGPTLDDGAESLLRDAFVMHVTQYEGGAIAPSEEFEVTWVTMEYELEKIVEAGLIPQDSIASSGLDEGSYKAFKLCAEELQSNLFEGKLLESLSNLRGFRRLFSQSSEPFLRHTFRGKPLEVLQNIFYGGDGILPEDRMMLADPFCHKEANSDDFRFDD